MLFHGGLSVVFSRCAGLAALWLAFAVTMRKHALTAKFPFAVFNIRVTSYNLPRQRILLLGLLPGTKNPVP